MKYKSQILNELLKRQEKNPFFHMTGTREEKEYVREQNCTYVIKVVYGGEKAIIKDKKTNEKIELPLYREA
jgi:hypothetical protein